MAGQINGAWGPGRPAAPGLYDVSAAPQLYAAPRTWGGPSTNGANPWGPGPAPVATTSKGGKLVLAAIALLVVVVVAIGTAVNDETTNNSWSTPADPVATAPVGDNDPTTLASDVLEQYNEDGADDTDATCVQESGPVFECILTDAYGSTYVHEVTVSADGTTWVASATN